MKLVKQTLIFCLLETVLFTIFWVLITYVIGFFHSYKSDMFFGITFKLYTFCFVIIIIIKNLFIGIRKPTIAGEVIVDIIVVLLLILTFVRELGFNPYRIILAHLSALIGIFTALYFYTLAGKFNKR